MKKSNTTKNPPPKAPESVSLSTEVRSWTYLSVGYLMSAKLFVQKSRNIELLDREDESLIEKEDLYRAYVLSSVLLSVAFLEATINEIYEASIDEFTESGTLQIKPNLKKNLALIEKIIRDKYSFRILEKYQLALIAADKNEFDKGKEPYQEVDLLIRLRNSLVHYKPEWVSEDARKHKIGQELQKRFRPNPFIDVRIAYYPEKCLSAGCAEWAYRSSIAFVDDFAKRLGIIPPFKSSLVGLPIDG